MIVSTNARIMNKVRGTRVGFGRVGAAQLSPIFDGVCIENHTRFLK